MIDRSMLDARATVDDGARSRKTKGFTHALAAYQRRAVEQLALDIGETHRQIAICSGDRVAVAKERGLRLLVAPTGAGKTLILGRAIETLVPDPIVPLSGFRGSIWFWFTPYSGLVDQTRLALRAQCPGLRLRDPARDREPSTSRDGDVFVSTWGAVAANNREARVLRRSSERAWSLDGMIEALRQDGYFIGCVIDEAHQNFGVTAREAARFYLETLRPDTTILATATPRDAKLSAFLKASGYADRKDIRIEIGRREAVTAHLVKRGLILAHLVLSDANREMVDEEETLLRAAILQHRDVKQRLAHYGLDITPLLLVQVPNEGFGSDAAKVKEFLVGAGLPDKAIRIHTASQPDPAFRNLAADESVEALIFKMSAATGFDAPRAHSLVSLRPLVTPEFGVQVIGRVMRVDPRVRANEAAREDPLLARASVFVTGRRQPGLETAAEHLAALRTSIAPIAVQASFFEADEVREMSDDERSQKWPDPHLGRGDFSQRAGKLVGHLQEEARRVPSKDWEVDEPGLWGTGPIDGGAFSRRHGLSRPGYKAYDLNRRLGVPDNLLRMSAPDADELDDLAREAAACFRIDDRVKSLLVSPRNVDVELHMRELFEGYAERSRFISARPSPAKMAAAAQAVFRFSDDIDPRAFRKHLVGRFREEVIIPGGRTLSDIELARAIDILAVFQPGLIKDALAQALARHASVVQSAPLPDHFEDRINLFEARRAAYGVFPSGMNGPERRFAETLDRMDGVKWWLRNSSHPACEWSVRLQLPNGKGFYPDFVIGVDGRDTEGSVLLAEIKDDGSTGRLHSDDNLAKIRARIRQYDTVLWVSEENGESARFVRLGLSDDRDRIVPRGTFSSADLR